MGLTRFFKRITRDETDPVDPEAGKAMTISVLINNAYKEFDGRSSVSTTIV